jgi:hypothetical protein
MEAIMEVAQTILEQLGGKAFTMITGSKNLTAIENGLRMTPGRNPKGVQMVEVILDGNDTYTVTSYQRSQDTFTELAKEEMVYDTQLQDIFESLTGLYTTLQPRK